MEDILKNILCDHAIRLSGIESPIYAVLMKVGDPTQEVAVLEPSPSNLLIKYIEDDDEKIESAGVCLNELLEILQYDAKMGQHDLVILSTCPCSN